MEKTLYTFRKFDYLDLVRDVQELFELISYLDNCSLGQTEDMKSTLVSCYYRINELKRILNFNYLFPSL